jgi:hypothetical protein
VQVLLDPFRAEKIERKLRKSIAFARVRRKRGEGKGKIFFSSSWIRREKKLSKREREEERDEGPQKREKRGGGKKKFELVERREERVFVGNHIEEKSIGNGVQRDRRDAQRRAMADVAKR